MTAIVGLTADHLRIPFRRPFPTASGMWLERDTWILRVRAADGRIGMGEAVLESADHETAEVILAALIREAVDGAADGRLPDLAELEVHGAAGRALNAAFEAALQDLGSDAVPPGLRSGGEGVGVNATIPSLGPSAAGLAAQQSVELGFLTLKLKIGAERETDALVDRVRTIRTAIGPDVALRLDVNGAWDLATAVDRLEAIAKFDIEFVEQPLPADDIDGLAELRRRIRIPVAADEAVTSTRAARALLAADAVDVLVVKPARVGGLAATAAIAEMASERNVPVVVSTLFETGVGMAAALAAAAALPDVASSRVATPLDHGLATAGLLEHDLLAMSLPVVDGRLFAVGGPGSGGLGIVLDEQALGRYRIEMVGTAT